MAYNTFQPNTQYTYQQPMYYQQPTIPTAPSSPQTSSLIWVQGETGAKSYLVAPNTTIPLWDSERQVIYIKSADASGMPTMKILDYTIRENANASTTQLNTSNTSFATVDDINTLKNEIDALKDKLESYRGHNKNYTNKKEGNRIE